MSEPSGGARSGPLGGRRRFPGPGRNQLSLSLLPLLDVMTSTIGVFLTILTFQVYASGAPRSAPAADMLIVVEPDNSFLLVTRGAASPQEFFLSQIKTVLLKLGGLQKRPIRILAAFGPQSLEGRTHLQRALDVLARRDGKAGKPAGTIAAVPESVSFTLSWVPLDSSGEERARLLQQWTAPRPD